MKKVIVVMLMLVGFATFAQEEKQAGKRAEMEKMTPEQIMEVNMPTGIPLVYELDGQLNVISKKFIGDANDVEKAMSAVAKQGQKK